MGKDVSFIVMLMQFLTTHEYLANTKLILFHYDYTEVLYSGIISFSLRIYTFKLPHVWDISRVGWGWGGGGSHEPYCQNTGQRRADQCFETGQSHQLYNTRACVIAGGSRHSINTSTCTWQRYATLQLQTYNILVPFCRLFHVI